MKTHQIGPDSRYESESGCERFKHTEVQKGWLATSKLLRKERLRDIFITQLLSRNPDPDPEMWREVVV